MRTTNVFNDPQYSSRQSQVRASRRAITLSGFQSEDSWLFFLPERKGGYYMQHSTAYIRELTILLMTRQMQEDRDRQLRAALWSIGATQSWTASTKCVCWSFALVKC